MESGNQEKIGAMESWTRVLNAGGKAVAATYDVTVSAFSKLVDVVKKAPALQEKTKGIFTKGLGFIKPCEKGIFTKGLGIISPCEIGKIEKKIKENEKQIKSLYFEIGKEGSKLSEGQSPLETEAVKKLISDVRNYEKEIERLQKRIVEIKEDKAAEALRKKELKKSIKLAKLNEKARKEKATSEEIKKIVEVAIQNAVKSGEFESRSEQEIFSKVANDLLDDEMEIKCLAAAELGKIRNSSAVPVLMEVVKFDNPNLISEVINSLIAIGDSKAVSLFKDQIKSQKYSVRIGCLRGLYKLADNDVAMPLLLEALRDDHPEVRRTALTFIGWKDFMDASPSVIQCLRDEEARVRKAAVSALANLKDESSILPLMTVLGDKDLETREKAFDAIKIISGEDIQFDVHLTGKELAAAIKNLKDFWQKERMGRTESIETPNVEETSISAPVEPVLEKVEKVEDVKETVPKTFGTADPVDLAETLSAQPLPEAVKEVEVPKETVETKIEPEEPKIESSAVESVEKEIAQDITAPQDIAAPQDDTTKEVTESEKPIDPEVPVESQQ